MNKDEVGAGEVSTSWRQGGVGIFDEVEYEPKPGCGCNVRWRKPGQRAFGYERVALLTAEERASLRRHQKKKREYNEGERKLNGEIVNKLVGGEFQM